MRKLAHLALLTALIPLACGDDGGGDSDASGTADTTTTDTTGDTSTTVSPETSDSSPTSTTDSTSTSDTGTTDTGTADTGTGTTGGQTIPDPGPGMDNWQSQGDVSTPGMAWQVGIGTQSVPYLEGTAMDDGNAFFVFEAGPALTMFTAQVFGGQIPDFIHMHDGTGMIFGDEIPPDNTTQNSASFTLTPGNIYVLEIHFPGAGFF